MIITTREGKQAYRILKLTKRTLPHKLNPTEDYQRLQEIALSQKQAKAVDDWKNRKKQVTYIRVTDEYKDCSEVKDWIPN